MSRARRGGIARVLAACALVGLAACSASTSSSPPAYSARDRSGDRVSMADLHGAPALLTSWATWCKECKELLPSLEQLHEDQAANGVQVVAVNVNAPGAEDDVLALEREYGMDMARWRDVDNDFAQAFRSRGVPTSVLVDSDGVVLLRWPGGIPLDDPTIQRVLDRALRDASD